ncbi:MAG: hypothetical protein FWG50_05760 [Kiritimatiellaeota bacterium]|nr:hypothetical protein [Kiritimatiellota bacterium]
MMKTSEMRKWAFAVMAGVAATAAMAQEPFVAVTNITGVTVLTMAGEWQEFNPAILPETATNTAFDIEWTIKDAGTTGVADFYYRWTIASDADGTRYYKSVNFETENSGTLVLTATITNGVALGVDYTQDFTITVLPLFAAVTNITAVPAAAVAGVPLTLGGTVEPLGATRQTIVWSVTDAGGTGASFSGDTLTATAAGSVTLTATIAGGLAESHGPVALVAASYEDTLAVKADGTLWTWGYNRHGIMGNNMSVPRLTPSQIGTDDDWATVTIGWIHNVALKVDGTLWTWGQNGNSQLGLGDDKITHCKTPTQIGTGYDWATLSAGFVYTVATKNDGTLWAWGDGYFGDGMATRKNVPTQIGTDDDWATVTAGYYHTLALKNDGTLWAWGSNGYGQLGDNTTTYKTVPTQVGTDDDWATLAAGAYHTLALKADGTLWAWGRNYNGQLGDNTTDDKTVPTKIGTDDDWATIAAGGYHTLAVKADGTLWAWGYNGDGQLGDNTTVNKSVPTQVGTDDDWASVAAGEYHTLAVKADASLWAWGGNWGGQLGDNTKDDKLVPTLILSPEPLDYTQEFTLTVEPAPAPFVAVTDIAQIGNVTQAGLSLTLAGRVVPADATHQDIVWSVKDAGTTGATIAGNIFTSTAPGKATVTATIAGGAAGGADFTKDVQVTVYTFVAVASVSLPDTVVATNGVPFTLHGLVIAETPSMYSAGRLITLEVADDDSGDVAAEIDGETTYVYIDGFLRGACEYTVTPSGTGTLVLVARVVDGLAPGLDYTHEITVTVVPADGPDPYLSDPEAAVSEKPPYQTTAYDGFLYDTNNTVRGTVTLKATMKEKKDKKTGIATTNWTVSAKAVMQNASLSFSGKPVGALERFTAHTKNNAETLDVFMQGDRFFGTLSGAKVDGTFTVDGAHAVFADKKAKPAQDRLDEFRGVYNVALLDNAFVETDDYPSLPRGYLSLTVGNLGSVKFAGVLADGTKVSGSGKLLDFLNEDDWLAVALFRPLYSKKGFIGGLLWIDTDTKQVLVDAEYGWCVDWVCADPKKGGPFAYALDALGGYFGNGKAAVAPPAGLSFSADCGWLAGTLALQWDGLADGRWVEEAFPLGLLATPSGLKLSIDKGTAPKKPKGETEYDYETVRDRNPSLATISYTAKTGVFKGKFSLYYDGLNAKGALQHKAVCVSYSGLMIPHEDGLIGLGTGTATINKVKVGVPVFLQ